MEKITSKNRRHSSTKILGIVLGIILALYTLSLFFMIAWGMMTSVKHRLDFIRNIIGFPGSGYGWQWNNYVTAFNSFSVTVESGAGFRTVLLGEMFLNSVLYALGCAIASTTCACFMAYLTARFPYKFSKVVYAVVVVAMIVPIVGNLPSEIQMSRTFGLFDTFYGIWIMKANFLGMYFLVFYAVFRSVPKDYAEAAKIDGAGNFTVLFRIMMPMVAGTYFTVLLLNFIAFWNDYQVPLIYLPTHPPVALGLYKFNFASSGSLSNVPMKLAGSFLVLLPVLVVFLAFHKRLLGKIHMGGLKE